MRITSTDDDIKEEFPFYQSPTTSPGKDESVLGIKSIQKADDVEDVPLADRHVSLNKEKAKVIKKKVKRDKEKNAEKGDNEKGELAREAKNAAEKKKSLMEEVLEILY